MHSILIIITTEQISISVLSRAICREKYYQKLKLHVMAHLHTVFRKGGPLMSFQHDLEKKPWNEVTVINPLQS